MNDWDEVVAFALSLPDTELSTSYGRPAVKLRGKAFAPGAYRLRAVARDAGENVSKTAVAAFRVVR